MTTESESVLTRIVELETRQAFQDNTIEELNEVIISQQQQLERLEADLARLRRQVGLLTGDGGEARSGGHDC